MEKQHCHHQWERQNSADSVAILDDSTQDVSDGGGIFHRQSIPNVRQNNANDINGAISKTTSYYPFLPQRKLVRSQRNRRNQTSESGKSGYWGVSDEVYVDSSALKDDNKYGTEKGHLVKDTCGTSEKETPDNSRKLAFDDILLKPSASEPEVQTPSVMSVAITKKGEPAAQTPYVADPWEIDPAELQFGECVGVGAAAEVFRATWHGTDVAVKKLRQHHCPSTSIASITPDLPTRLRRELTVLLDLRHPNLVLFMGAATLKSPTLIVAEFCEGGTIFQVLYSQPKLRLSWAQRLKMAMDTAKGMNFLHRRRVVHRDLKSLNLLLVSRIGAVEDVPWVKISDFGLSRHLPSPDQYECGQEISNAPPAASLMTGGLGTCLWMAPEVLSGSLNYNEKVDVYSFGMVLWELICRRVPFDGSGLEDPIRVAIAVSAGSRPDLRKVPVDCPLELRRTMEQCWFHEPTARLSFDVILERLKVLQDLPSGHSAARDCGQRAASAHVLRRGV